MTELRHTKPTDHDVWEALLPVKFKRIDELNGLLFCLGEASVSDQQLSADAFEQGIGLAATPNGAVKQESTANGADNLLRPAAGHSNTGEPCPKQVDGVTPHSGLQPTPKADHPRRSKPPRAPHDELEILEVGATELCRWIYLLQRPLTDEELMEEGGPVQDLQPVILARMRVIAETLLRLTDAMEDIESVAAALEPQGADHG